MVVREKLSAAAPGYRYTAMAAHTTATACTAGDATAAAAAAPAPRPHHRAPYGGCARPYHAWESSCAASSSASTNAAAMPLPPACDGCRRRTVKPSSRRMKVVQGVSARRDSSGAGARERGVDSAGLCGGQ